MDARRISGLKRETLASLKGLPGTLVVVPLVVLLFGSEWTAERDFEPSRGLRDRPSDGSVGQPLGSYLVPEGSRHDWGIGLIPGDSITFELPSVEHAFELEVQARRKDTYSVSVSADGTAYHELWDVPAVTEPGMRTRRERFAAPEAQIRYVRLEPSGDAERFRLSGIRATYVSAVVNHWWLVPILWGAFGVAVLASRSETTRRFGERWLADWRRADSWLATALVLLIVFRLTPDVILVMAATGFFAGGIVLFAHSFARSPMTSVVYVLFLYGLFFVLLPYGVGQIATLRAGAFYDLTNDHRLRPDGRDINSDGIRFRGEAEDLADDDFVVLVLGDSFTYGLKLSYEQSYPYALERMLEARSCRPRVRTVNFAWVSSSPLLSLRLLKQVGAKYRPDLVIYNLDMTDFHDDLRYANELRRVGDLEIDYDRVFREFVASLSARLPIPSGVPEAVDRLLRSERREPAADGDLPWDRFFATSRSLDESRADIERGVMKNLAEIQRYADDSLGAPMALVVYPRAYQYSAREAPKNWEGHRYERLGPFVREPFRYFDEVADSLAYPVWNLLPVFESAERYPLFFEDDPHWNPVGAQMVAEAVADRIGRSDWLECR